MNYSAEATIDFLPPMSNMLLRGNWRKRHGLTLKWKFYTSLAFANKRPPEPLTKAKLTLTRHSNRRPDHDGLVSGFKAIIDGLVETGVIQDDSFEVIGTPIYLWEKAPNRKGFVTVRVESI